MVIVFRVVAMVGNLGGGGIISTGDCPSAPVTLGPINLVPSTVDTNSSTKSSTMILIGFEGTWEVKST